MSLVIILAFIFVFIVVNDRPLERQELKERRQRDRDGR